MSDTRSEREKMLSGQRYRVGDPELVTLRRRAQSLMRAYNATVYGEDHARAHLLGELLGTWNGAVIRPTFSVDYGVNIHCGKGVFLNYGCVILDVCEVHIGAGTQVGPLCQLLTADHPRDPEVRAAGLESGRPLHIGRNVWIGGGAILLPGITVGDNAIIGAGAVVTRDVAAGATVAGNPARPSPST